MKERVRVDDHEEKCTCNECSYYDLTIHVYKKKRVTSEQDFETVRLGIIYDNSNITDELDALNRLKEEYYRFKRLDETTKIFLAELKKVDEKGIDWHLITKMMIEKLENLYK